MPFVIYVLIVIFYWIVQFFIWIVDRIQWLAEKENMESWELILLACVVVFALIAILKHAKEPKEDSISTPPPPPNEDDIDMIEVITENAEKLVPGYVCLRYGQTVVEFQLARKDGGDDVRAYLLSHPPYGNLSKGQHETHRLRDNNGRYYMCFGNPQPTKPDETIEKAKTWLLYTDYYVRTGICLK